MRRKVLFVIVSIALLCCVLGALVACESYKADPIETVGDAEAVVKSNGGLAVTQGDYLYFINGYTGYLTENGEDNHFGSVSKGAIYRVSCKDGVLGTDYQVIVPKSIMASSEDVGFSIYGEYIYYVSPSPEENRNTGEVKTSTLQFLRTKIDGTGTELILSVKNNAVRYKYTPISLFVYNEETLYVKDLTAKSFKASDMGKVIDEDVTAIHFPKSEMYDPKVGATVADYVFYTKQVEPSDTNYTNILYAVSPDGSEKVTVIKENSYKDKPYSIEVIASGVEDGAITLYYTKGYYVGTSSTITEAGTYAYIFADKKFDSFNEALEKKLTSSTLSTVYADGGKGLIVSGSSQNTVFYRTEGGILPYGELKMDKLIAIDATYFYYLNGDDKLMRFARDDNSNACYAYDSDEKFMTSFASAEYIDGCIYGIVDDDYDYMYRIDLSTIDVKDPSSVSFERIGVVTAEDEAKMKEAEENEDDED